MPDPAARSLKICVAADAPAPVRHSAEALLASIKSHPLLAILAGAHPLAALTDSNTLLAGPADARAYDHLVLVGLPSDPLIKAAWQREARVREDGGLYIFGFGYLRGDIGYIESDRNPFLHSRFVARAPFETEAITLTGSNSAGVALAVQAFLRQSLLNGVVAAPGWTRPEPNLLERDPLPPDFVVPALFPDQAGDWIRVGFSQAAEDEYRGVLADAVREPSAIWRAKYYKPGVWDGAGAAAAFANYAAGLHRRAYGDTLWAARFSSAADAAAAATKIAGTAGLTKKGATWNGSQPPYGSLKVSPGPLTLGLRGDWVWMSTVPSLALLPEKP